MVKNRLIISSAGSGKTTFIVNEALEHTSDKILITTYTEANEAEIIRKILKQKKSIPSNIKVQTWFSFLIQHGVKPYQGSFNECMFENEIKGLLLVNSKSGFRCVNSFGKPMYFGEEDNFKKHYFSNGGKIYSDKLSKFVFKSNKSVSNEIVHRINRLFDRIYIDEVQDLAGYDLEIVKLLFKSQLSILLVGDPRQVTYLTHQPQFNKKYRYGKIKDFLVDNCKSLIKDKNCIDESSLKVSHRNNSAICYYSSKLYPDLPQSKPCECEECRKIKPSHEGIFLIRKKDVDKYLKEYKPVQLRWSVSTKVNPCFETHTFGKSKGVDFERILIYPTGDMKKWINENDYNLKPETRAKFYVAITRARHSVGIVFDYDDSTNYDNLLKRFK